MLLPHINRYFNCVVCIFILMSGAICCQKEQTKISIFREISTSTSKPLTSVWFLDKKNGFVTGGETWERGFILSTTDGGESWQTDTTVSKIVTNIFFDKNGQGYACGLDGRLLIRPLGSTHWQGVREDYLWYRSIYFKNAREGWLVAGEGWKNGKLLRFSGENFQRDTVFEFPNELDAITFCSDTVGFAAGMGQLLRTTDAGKSWTPQDVPKDFYQAIQFLDNQVGFVCGYSGTILGTTDSGETWNILREGSKSWQSNAPLRDIFFRDKNLGFVVGEAGIFLKTTNGGDTWLAIDHTAGEVDFTKIFMMGQSGWLTAKNGKCYYFVP